MCGQLGKRPRNRLMHTMYMFFYYVHELHVHYIVYTVHIMYVHVYMYHITCSFRNTKTTLPLEHTYTLSITDCISDFLFVFPYNWVDQVSGVMRSPASIAILTI